MATYPVINKETGEQKEVAMSIHDWDQWRDDNPDWERDYSDPSTMPGLGVEVGEWKDKLVNKNPGWGRGSLRHWSVIHQKTIKMP